MQTSPFLPLVHDCWLGKCRCEQHNQSKFQGKYFLNGAVGEENMRYIGGGSDCCRHKFDSRGDFSRGNEHLWHPRLQLALPSTSHRPSLPFGQYQSILIVTEAVKAKPCKTLNTISIQLTVVYQSVPASQPTNKPPTQWAKIEHASISILINVDLNSRRYKEYLRRCSTRPSTDIVWTSCTVNTDNTATYCHTTWTSQHNRIRHRVINVHPH